MPGKRTVAVNPMFKMGFVTNCVICGVSLVIMIVVSYWPPENHVRSEELFFVFKHTFMLTAGAFLGLVGAKVSSPEH